MKIAVGSLCLTLLGAQSIDQVIESHLSAAKTAERANQYARASAEYRQILTYRPDSPQILQNLGLTLHLQGLYAEAIPEFQRAVALDPELWGAHLFLGMSRYRVNDFAGAIPALERSLQLNARMAETEARFWLGRSYLALSRHRAALQEFRSLADLKPNDVEVLYHLGKAYDGYGSALFEEIGRIEPNSSLVYLLQAERLASENRAVVARTWYARAVAGRPDLRDSIKTLEPVSHENASLRKHAIPASDIRARREIEGFLRSLPEPAAGAIQRGETQTAIPVLKELSDRTGSKWARMYLARAYINADQTAAAEDLLNAVLGSSPKELDALYDLGRLYKKSAAAAFQRLSEVAPDSHRTHQLLGERHEDATEYSRALEAYKAALARQPDLAGIRYSIGNVYWKLRDYAQAEQWLTQELKTNSHHGLAHARLGEIYVDQGRHVLAVDHLERALKMRPDLSNALLPLGRAYLGKNLLDRAIEVLQQYAQVDPENDRAQYLLSTALSRRGRVQEAGEAMRKFRELSRRRHEQTQSEVQAINSDRSR